MGPPAGQDKDGLLVKRMGEAVDGEYRNTGRYRAPTFASISSANTRLCSSWSSTERRPIAASLRVADTIPKGLRGLPGRRSAHGSPTVILAKTIKGYGLGEAGEGRNITHQQKKLNEESWASSAPASAFPSPTNPRLPFYKPPRQQGNAVPAERRKALGGFVPRGVRAAV